MQDPSGSKAVFQVSMKGTQHFVSHGHNFLHMGLPFHVSQQLHTQI